MDHFVAGVMTPAQIAKEAIGGFEPRPPGEEVAQPGMTIDEMIALIGRPDLRKFLGRYDFAKTLGGGAFEFRDKETQQWFLVEALPILNLDDLLEYGLGTPAPDSEPETGEGTGSAAPLPPNDQRVPKPPGWQSDWYPQKPSEEVEKVEGKWVSVSEDDPAAVDAITQKEFNGHKYNFATNTWDKIPVTSEEVEADLRAKGLQDTHRTVYDPKARRFTSEVIPPGVKSQEDIEEQIRESGFEGQYRAAPNTSGDGGFHFEAIKPGAEQTFDQPQFVTDPATGLRFQRSCPTCDWEEVNELPVTKEQLARNLEEAMTRLLVKGDRESIDKALAIRAFANKPSDLEIFKAALQAATSEFDFETFKMFYELFGGGGQRILAGQELPTTLQNGQVYGPDGVVLSQAQVAGIPPPAALPGGPSTGLPSFVPDPGAPVPPTGQEPLLPGMGLTPTERFELDQLGKIDEPTAFEEQRFRELTDRERERFDLANVAALSPERIAELQAQANKPFLDTFAARAGKGVLIGDKRFPIDSPVARFFLSQSPEKQASLSAYAKAGEFAPDERFNVSKGLLGAEEFSQIDQLSPEERAELANAQERLAGTVPPISAPSINQEATQQAITSAEAALAQFGNLPTPDENSPFWYRQHYQSLQEQVNRARTFPVMSPGAPVDMERFATLQAKTQPVLFQVPEEAGRELTPVGAGVPVARDLKGRVRQVIGQDEAGNQDFGANVRFLGGGERFALAKHTQQLAKAGRYGPAGQILQPKKPLTWQDIRRKGKFPTKKEYRARSTTVFPV